MSSFADILDHLRLRRDIGPDNRVVFLLCDDIELLTANLDTEVVFDSHAVTADGTAEEQTQLTIADEIVKYGGSETLLDACFRDGILEVMCIVLPTGNQRLSVYSKSSMRSQRDDSLYHVSSKSANQRGEIEE